MRLVQVDFRLALGGNQKISTKTRGCRGHNVVIPKEMVLFFLFFIFLFVSGMGSSVVSLGSSTAQLVFSCTTKIFGALHSLFLYMDESDGHLCLTRTLPAASLPSPTYPLFSLLFSLPYIVR